MPGRVAIITKRQISEITFAPSLRTGRKRRPAWLNRTSPLPALHFLNAFKSVSVTFILHICLDTRNLFHFAFFDMDREVNIIGDLEHP